MFCSNCGAQNAGGVRFCSSCGSAIVAVDPTPVTPTPAFASAPTNSAKKILGLKPLFFALTAGGAALAVVLVAVFAVVALNKPLPTEQTSRDFLLSYDDVSTFNMQSDSKPLNQLTQTASFIYGECGAKTEFQNVTKVGVNLGLKSFAGAQDAADVWVSSQLLKFPTEEDAKAVLAVLKDGATDPACDTPSLSDYYSGGEDVSKTYGVDVEGVNLIDDWTNTVSDGVMKNTLVVARRGNILLYVQTHNIDSSGVSDSDVSAMVSLALKKFKG